MIELEGDEVTELSSPLKKHESTEIIPDPAIGSVEALVDESDSKLDADTTFELLKNHRRREVLRLLRDNGGTLSLGEVAEFVAAKENGIEEVELTSKQRKRVYVALYQCHLPMMDKAGVIDFNQPRGTLTLETVATQLDKYLVDQVPVSDRWSHYLSVTAFGGLTYLFAALLIGPGSAFSTLSVVGMVSGLLVLSILDGREAIRSKSDGRLYRGFDQVTTGLGTVFVRLGGRLGGSNN